MRSAAAPAKMNLALVVGPLRRDGKHEVVTVMQGLDLHDTIALRPARELRVLGFEDDTLVGAALHALAVAAGVEESWEVRIAKRIPVASGLGGGSSDAATALRLANETLQVPLELRRLELLAATIGADVPFFLGAGTQLATGDGTTLAPLGLPLDYAVVLLLPAGEGKASTAAVYGRFDDRDGAVGFDDRRAALLAALERVRRPEELALLPPNDLARSPHAERLLELGAFRADVSGAGPCLYGLFRDRTLAEAAARELRPLGSTWVTAPRRGTR